MDLILDETSLIPCDSCSPAKRIEQLAKTIKAFDQLGFSKILRSTKCAPDRDLGSGRGLRDWCFDPGTNRDSWRIVAARLGKQPFIDGPGGLFSRAEADRVVEARLGSVLVVGLGLAALEKSSVIALSSAARPKGEKLNIELTIEEEEGDRQEPIEVVSYVLEAEVDADKATLEERVRASVASGPDLINRLSDLCPHLRLGPGAEKQIRELTGSESSFLQLLCHLRALDSGARNWAAGQKFEPPEIRWSHESKATLKHGDYGPMRDFQTPAGYDVERWSSHTKLTGPGKPRLYFRAIRHEKCNVVLIGYFGPHLPTVSDPR